MAGVGLIMRLTVVESLRRRVATAALVVGVAFLALFGTGLYFIHRDIERAVRAHGPSAAVQAAALTFVVMAGMYAANFLAMMASVVAALETVAGEIGSGVLEALCVRPVRRSSILLGKWLGSVVLVVAYVVFLLGGVALVAGLVAGAAPRQIAQGLALICLEGVLLTTVTLALGTRLAPLASGIAVLGLYGLAFVGGWVEQVGTLVGNSTARLVGIVASLIMPSEALWQLASYRMQSPLVRDLGVSPFSVASVPSPPMVAWAAGLTLLALAAAARLFGTRDL
jgi:Cu-processing system permease protein